MKRLLVVSCMLILSYMSKAADSNWPAQTHHVINKIFEEIKMHHPGMLDKKNPNFFADLQRDYDQACAKAENAQNSEKLIEIAENFAQNEFRRTIWRRPGAQQIIQQPAQTHAKARLEIEEETIKAYFPSFRASNDDEKRTIENVITELAQSLKQQRNKTLIINFEGNSGLGNSSWGDEIFKAVWGQRSYEIIKSQQTRTQYYRVTSENYSYMNEISNKPMPFEFKKIFVGIAQKMQENLNKSDCLLEYQIGTDRIDEELIPLSFPVQIYTDGQIGRAVRSFLPLALKAGAQLIGASIPACSPYAEVREISIYEENVLLLPIAACFDDNDAYKVN